MNLSGARNKQEMARVGGAAVPPPPQDIGWQILEGRLGFGVSQQFLVIGFLENDWMNSFVCFIPRTQENLFLQKDVH